MKKSILLLLLCSILLTNVACKDKRSSTRPAVASSAEEQAQAKYNAYQRSAAEFFGDFASRYRQVHRMLQQGYDFTDFYYFSDDLQKLQSNLQKALALPGDYVLDNKAQDYLNAINALLPMDKKLSDYSNQKSWLKDGGAATGPMCRQLLPLLKEAARTQQDFAEGLQQAEDHNLWSLLHKYNEGTPQRYRLTALYYARRIYQGFIDWSAAYDNQPAREQQLLNIKIKLEQDIAAFDKNASDYIVNMSESGSCALFMNNLVDFIGESRAISTNFKQGGYLIKRAINTPINTTFIRRNNDLLILKRNYLKVIESYNQGGC